MKYLLCAEFFFPSVGGVQEVVKQIAIRLAAHGHDVTVATSRLSERVSSNFGDIKIVSFDVKGNQVKGLIGEVEQYKQFVLNNEFDVIFIYAAQQWTFDALLDDFSCIKAKKVFVPCGFSALYSPTYRAYFDRMAVVLNEFDAVIFHSAEYRDYEFAQKHHVRNCFVIPNGADNREFENAPPEKFRSAHGISPNNAVLMTVGSLNGGKGHLELALAVAAMRSDKAVTLVLNGNSMPSIRRCFSFNSLKQKISILLIKTFILRWLIALGIRDSYFTKLQKVVKGINNGKYGENKRVIVCDLPRQDLITCFFEADLFVFASHIEYSPLVLYESCAAGLPFLSVPVGNTNEIVKWTGGGQICPAPVDKYGYTHVDPSVLASKIDRMISDQALLDELGKAGRAAWQNRFNWDDLVMRYEAVFQELAGKPID